MNTIRVIEGPQGCGKTTFFINEMANTRGRYLYASPTIDLIEEQYGRIRNINSLLPVRAIHSRNGQRGNVSRQLSDLPQELAVLDHVVAFTTHESLMEADLSSFSDWHLCIDEPPQAVVCGKLRLEAGWRAFEQAFRLEHDHLSDWASLVPKRSSGSWKKFDGDDIWGRLTNFRKHAERLGVHIRAADWSECQDREVEWLSMWSPIAQQAFQSITLLGTGYQASIGFKAMHALHPDLKIISHPIAAKRSAQPLVTISYFTDSHEGSTTYWASSEGRRALVQVQNWMSANVPGLGFWSGNEAVRNSFEHRLHGTMSSPKLAGLNHFRSSTSCAFFYSSKPLPEDAIIQDIFDLTEEDIYAAREGEDLAQFVMRGAIRSPEFGGTYDIYLYSRSQADYLRRALLQSGFMNVELCPIPGAGIMEVTRSKSSRPMDLTPAQVLARTERKRKNSRKSSKAHRARKAALKESGSHSTDSEKRG